MGLIKQVILDHKFFEASEEIDAFLERNEISEEFMVTEFNFSIDAFKEEPEVGEWLNSYGFSVDNIQSNDRGFKSVFFDISNFLESSVKQIEIRRGVTMTVGILKGPFIASEAKDIDTSWNLSLRNYDGIKLSEDSPSIIELAKVVKGFHPSYGEVDITEKMLQKFKMNFDNRVTGIDISIDYDHETREAAGWLKSVFLSYDGQTLLGEVKWTPKGALSLGDREFRYFSPEFMRNYVHPHTGVEHGPTLLGGALVNRPFLKMDAIVSLKQTSEVEMSTISLKDHEAKITEKDTEIEKLKLSEAGIKKVVEGQKVEITKLSAEIKESKEEKEKKEKEDKHNKLFSENKINKAQLTALNEGKELFEVLELNEKLNAKPAGSDKGNKNSFNLSEEEKSICKKFDLTEEEYVKYNS